MAGKGSIDGDFAAGWAAAKTAAAAQASEAEKGASNVETSKLTPKAAPLHHEIPL